MLGMSEEASALRAARARLAGKAFAACGSGRAVAARETSREELSPGSRPGDGILQFQREINRVAALIARSQWKSALKLFLSRQF